MNPSQYRKSPRANWIDYDDGIFFVTICTKDKINFFGEILDGAMHFSEIGKFADMQLQNANSMCNAVEIPIYVVMPNHIHTIIICHNYSLPFGSNNPINQRSPNPSLRANPDSKRHTPILSRYITSLKGAISKFAHRENLEFAWQSRFHDRLIRDHHEADRIAEYIATNVEQWVNDCFY